MNHDWAPIDPDDDPSEMCVKCLQCKCCETPTEECLGDLESFGISYADWEDE